MKKIMRHLPLLLSLWLLLSAVAAASAQGTTNVYVDPSQNWVGFMSWSPSPYTQANFPGDGGSASSPWGISALQANFNGDQATLQPCDNVYDSTSDPYWVNPDGTGANNMDANFYVESDPGNANPLGGWNLTFSGYCWADTLVTPYSTNMTAFIKEFAAGYAFVGETTVALTNGQPFSIERNTASGDIIQYGFEMVGPDVSSALIANYGYAIVSSNPPPSGPVLGQLPSSVYVNVTSNVSFTVSASGGTGSLSYHWQKNGVNLSDGPGISGSGTSTLALSNVTGASEATYTVVVTDSLNKSATASTYLVVFNPSNLTMDPNATFLGYINFFDTSGDYISGFAYPTALLRASMNNGVAVLQPNTDLYIDGPNYNGGYVWTNSDGTPAANLEMDYYIQNDALAGNTLNFNGFVPSDTVDPSYTATAWIEDFVPNYSSVTAVTATLTAGQPFNLSIATTAGDHIQYGLRLYGLDNSASSPLTEGAIQVSIPLPALAATRAGNTTTLTFPTASGFSYIVQYKNNLTDPAWQTLGTYNGTGAGQSANDTTTQGRRFYRLSIQ